MPVKVIWDVPKISIMRYIFEGSWEWKDYRAVIDEAVQESIAASGRVDVIADFTLSSGFPVRNAFPTLKHLSDTAPENSRKGLFVIVKGGSFAESLGKVYSRVYPYEGSSLCFVKTLEEAYEAIEADRSGKV